MNIMIAGDIHGSAKYCELLVKQLEKEEKCNNLLLLGDLLYHGPRNDLPEEYNPKKCIELLNGIKKRVFCVRGNCDAEVDQMVLNFPIMADYLVLDTGENIIYASHGHHYNPSTPFKGIKNYILLNGHTHIPALEQFTDFVYINPGSVSIPKKESFHSYITYIEGIFEWKNIENGLVYNSFKTSLKKEF